MALAWAFMMIDLNLGLDDNMALTSLGDGVALSWTLQGFVTAAPALLVACTASAYLHSCTMQSKYTHKYI